MRTICNVVPGPAEGHGIPDIGQSEPGRPGAASAHVRVADLPLDVALRATETALGEVSKVVMDDIRVDGEVSPHIEAAERDLRTPLRQLGMAKREPGRDA
jgi:hypothetical protein